MSTVTLSMSMQKPGGLIQRTAGQIGPHSPRLVHPGTFQSSITGEINRDGRVMPGECSLPIEHIYRSVVDTDFA